MKASRNTFEILDRKTCIYLDDENGEKPAKLQGNIDVKDVYFAYPTHPDVMISNKFSLSIKEGQRVALVGESARFVVDISIWRRAILLG